MVIVRFKESVMGSSSVSAKLFNSFKLSMGLSVIISLLHYLVDGPWLFSLIVFGCIFIFSFPLLYWMQNHEKVMDLKFEDKSSDLTIYLDFSYTLRDTYSVWSEVFQIVILVGFLSSTILFLIMGEFVVMVVSFVFLVLLGCLFYWMAYFVHINCKMTDKGILIGKSNTTPALLIWAIFMGYEEREGIIYFKSKSYPNLCIPLLDQRDKIIPVLQRYVPKQ